MGCNCGKRGIEARQRMRALREQRALERLQAQQSREDSVEKQGTDAESAPQK